VSDFFAHPSAVVDAGASIGDRTRIWHFCHVSAGARIGADCSFGQNAYVASGVRIGDGVKVQNNVSIYAGVVLEDFVFCGPSVVFTNVRVPRALHPQGPESYARTVVRRGASIGANATVVCGVTIGRFALVGAGAVVTKDVPDHGFVMGVPARSAGWACECGERLQMRAPRREPPHVRGPSAVCGACGRRYRCDQQGQLSALEDPGR
jgi:UDP-2-acetamido-3-amino-2,3-dideoxy-glucuronate N-acetyltransferase